MIPLVYRMAPASLPSPSFLVGLAVVYPTHGVGADNEKSSLVRWSIVLIGESGFSSSFLCVEG